MKREARPMRLRGREALPDPDTLGVGCGAWGMRRRASGTRGAGAGARHPECTAPAARWAREVHVGCGCDALIEGEKRDARWSDPGVRGYMPLRGFLFETPVCLVDEFREGNVSPGAGQVAFYRMCRARMPVGKRMARYRAASASYQAADQWIGDRSDAGAITADQDVAVKAVIASLLPDAWQEPTAGCGDQVAEAVHTMNQTTAAFRLLIKREKRRQHDLCEEPTTPYTYHVVASNWPVEEKTAHEDFVWHNQRGQAENFNKELKHGLGLEQLPCGNSGANAVFFRIGVLACNLFIGFKRLACPAAGASQTITTVRWSLVQVAEWILRHAERVIVRLGLDAETLAAWHGIRQRCWALSVAT